MNKPLFIFGIALLLAGVAFTSLSHDLHNTILGAITLESESHEHLHEEHGSHDTHQLAGIALALIGIALTIGGLKK